jgi:four helix bundle protein
MHNFKEFKFWQKSVDLSVLIYKITSTFPNEEKFGLVSQLRRASVSIASNMAEGASKNGDK